MKNENTSAIVGILVQDIISHMSATTATGEWAWINKNKRHSYMEILERRDPKEIEGCLTNMFINGAAYGLVTEGVDGKIVAKDIEHDLSYFNDVRPVPNPSECGQLQGIHRDGGVIAPDAPRHGYYATKILSLIKDLEKPTVVEIGGGYGGVIREVMLRRNVKYINCDLPETLYLCFFFLRRTMPDLNVGWDMVCDVVLIPALEKNKIKTADIMFNANSLSEMGRETIVEYMELLHVLSPRYFLHQNSSFVLYPNSVRHIEIPASDFPIPGEYKQVYDKSTPWKGGSGRYREYLYERK